MAGDASLLMIVSGDRLLGSSIETLLAPFGWRCVAATDVSAALGAVEESAPAAFLVDRRPPQFSEIVAEIRELPVPHNGTPILTIGEPDPAPETAGTHLDLPLDEASFLGALCRRAGPLEDHALRQSPFSPRYRLIRLIGIEAADDILGRLISDLRHAIETTESGTTSVSAHRLAGIAGMCGFPDLSGVWAAVDRGDEGSLPAAIERSREAMEQLGAGKA